MNIHYNISERIANFLDNIYYKNLKKIYNDSLENIFCKFPIIKPDYFIYFQYYFIYTSFYYITYKKVIMYSLSLQSIYISGLIFDNLSKKYNYNPINNILFLKNTSLLFFLYLLFLKILFLRIVLYKKMFILSSFSIFYFLHNLNYIYKERLKYIELKKDFIHPLKIFIISPNKDFIKTVIHKTTYFTHGNYLLFINLLLFIFN